jgi:hypothetical protein
MGLTMPTIDIVGATRSYERWLGSQIDVVRPDLDKKHQDMARDPFMFLRATFYRWAELWPQISPDDAAAPRLLAVGDLHVENFGTWRDQEGRLVWGVNDFDEAHPMPYTIDLVRLAASVRLALAAGRLALPFREACDAILEGYRESITSGGRPLVLAEHDRWLRRQVWSELRDPALYWGRIEKLPELEARMPAAERVLRKALPPGMRKVRWCRRHAGEGSLGRQRIVATGAWAGALVAREAKSTVPSAWKWAHPNESTAVSFYEEALDGAVRCPDPYIRADASWIVRRIAPDCSRVELTEIPKKRDEARLLRAMGWETGNVHLGSRSALAAVKADLKGRTPAWLHRAARAMSDAVKADCKDWQRYFAARSEPG